MENQNQEIHRMWKFAADTVLTHWMGIGQRLDNPNLDKDAEYLRSIADKYILQSKKDCQIAQEMIDEMANAYRQSLPFVGEYETYGDALAHSYKMGLQAMIKKIITM